MNAKPVILGLDLGSVSIKAATLDPTGRVLRRDTLAAGGNPALETATLVERLLGDHGGEILCGITGGGKRLFAHLDGVYLENDLVATTGAVVRFHPEVRSVIEIGGHQSKWIKLGEQGQLETFALNDQCAAGSGAFLEQQAGRLRMTIQELSATAASTDKSATVAGRCAVFAKSDMIHLQQKGTPVAEIASGLCLALVRNFRATLLRGGDPVTPTLFLGGGALNAGLQQALVEVFELDEGDLVVTPHPQHYAAIGVALAASSHAEPVPITALIDFLRRVDDHGASGPSGGGRSETGNKAHPPLQRPSVQLLDEPRAPSRGEVRAYLGIDVGSVSTDLALLSPDGDVLDGTYLRTRGDPIGVLREGMAILKQRVGDRLNVLGIGTTGSGRHLAGRLLGADVVKNEITCQVYGARHVLPDVDTILEIGGQDSKFVSVRDGRITDFVMNKICAAGTGSFLEEQGASLGVSIFDEFADLAFDSACPADLGSQCTVFMEAEVVNARRQGRPIQDILAGLAYSVAKNYLDRVVSGREIGDKVVFQGGVASNKAVIAAFENLLGKPIIVHPYNRISGAIGAAVAVREAMKDATGETTSRFRGLDAIEEVRVSTFECHSCSNLCQVARIGIGPDTAFFGDVCEKFTSTIRAGAEDTSLPDLVGEIESTLESYAGGEPFRGIAGIPRASMMYDLFPFWSTFLRMLGFRVVLPGRSNMKVLEQGVRRLTAETCLPIKLVYGHVASLLEQGDIDFVFLPALVDIPDQSGHKSFLCPFEESVGFMVGTFAADKLIVPTISLTSPRNRIVGELRTKLAAYDVTAAEVSLALDAAQEVQERYHQTMRTRGREILDTYDGMIFGLLGKPYNIVDAFENLNLGRHLRKLGVLPLPMQMLPLASLDPDASGMTIPWRYNRDIIRALQGLARTKRIFPVVISNFGCGPDAFGTKHLDKAAGDLPYLFLEFDEHRGEAGLVTRLEAFIDEVSHVPAPRSEKAQSLPATTSGPGLLKGRRVVIPFFADHAWAYHGALRYTGAETLMLPPPDEETLAYGEEISSGKECHPYIIIAGDLMKHLDRGTIREGDIFFFPGTKTACLLHEYGNAMQSVLDRKGVKGVEVMSLGGAEHIDLLGLPATSVLGRGLLACDQLVKLKRQIRPYAVDKRKVDRLFQDIFPMLADKLAQDQLGDALRPLGRALDTLEMNQESARPVVGVAGDAYTRIHPFGNANMFDRLEELGLEVWPAPFLVDTVEFGWRRSLSEGLDDGRFKDAGMAAMYYLKKELEELRVRFLLGDRVVRHKEPKYKEVLEMAAPYVDQGGNEVVLLNVAKMVHFARNRASGIINAISFHCMLGTVSAAMTERIRHDHKMIPITTIMFTGKPSAEIDARLEAFAHQVKDFHERRVRELRDTGGIWEALMGGDQAGTRHPRTG